MSNYSRPCLIGIAILSVCLLGGCPPPEDDSLEPNDSRIAATPLALDVPVTARGVQGNPDVFAISVESGGALVFTVEDLDGQNCPGFTVTFSDGTVLYADGLFSCSPFRSPTVQVARAALVTTADGVYRLTVPADWAGTYYLEIQELPYADNLVPNGWDYRLTATVS